MTEDNQPCQTPTIVLNLSSMFPLMQMHCRYCLTALDWIRPDSWELLWPATVSRVGSYACLPFLFQIGCQPINTAIALNLFKFCQYVINSRWLSNSSALWLLPTLLLQWLEENALELHENWISNTLMVVEIGIRLARSDCTTKVLTLNCN